MDQTICSTLNFPISTIKNIELSYNTHQYSFHEDVREAWGLWKILCKELFGSKFQ